MVLPGVQACQRTNASRNRHSKVDFHGPFVGFFTTTGLFGLDVQDVLQSLIVLVPSIALSFHCRTPLIMERSVPVEKH